MHHSHSALTKTTAINGITNGERAKDSVGVVNVLPTPTQSAASKEIKAHMRAWRHSDTRCATGRLLVDPFTSVLSGFWMIGFRSERERGQAPQATDLPTECGRAAVRS